MSAAAPESDSGAPERWGGAPAPPLLRAVAAVTWLALAAHLIATALPGSRSGIEAWIRRADLIASVLAQLGTLLGLFLLVTLVVSTLGDHGLSYVYRLAVAPLAAAVFVPVSLGTRDSLEPALNLGLGVACLALATASSSSALRVPSTRAQGLVLSLVVLGASGRLSTRLLLLGVTPNDTVWAGRAVFLATAGHAFDAFGVALAAARFRSEQRAKGALALAAALIATFVVAWGALHGSADGASTWQVLAARVADVLTAAPIAFSTKASRTSVEILSLLLSGTAIFWPARISAGMISIALALCARAGADVPASALALALGALAAPLTSSEEAFVVGERRGDSKRDARDGQSSAAGAGHRT